MKRTLLQLVVLLLLAIPATAQIVDIPNINFKNALVNVPTWDTDGDDIPDTIVDANDDGEIQLTEAEAVDRLILEDFSIGSLVGINSFVNLTHLNVRSNSLTFLDISALELLQDLDLWGNDVTFVTYPADNVIEYLNLVGNELTSFDFSLVPNLLDVDLALNPITEIDLSPALNLVRLRMRDTQITEFTASDLTNIVRLEISGNDELETVALSNLPALDFASFGFGSVNSVFFEDLPNLRNLSLARSELENLDLTMLTGLETAFLLECSISDLNIAGMSNLRSITLYTNNISSLDLSGLPALRYIGIDQNPISDLDFELVPGLQQLEMSETNFTEIDLSLLPNLVIYRGGNDAIETLDFSQNPFLDYLILINTNASYVNLKNGSSIDNTFEITSTGNLEYICVDDDEVDQVMAVLEEGGVTETVINSYCSFEPGGDVYRIEGVNKYSATAEACVESDINFNALRYIINDGSTTGTVIPDRSGNYFLPLPEGDYSITTVLDNPVYYGVDPELVNASFPFDPSPFVQDYCVVPLGDFNDLEVVMAPLTIAQPGFDAEYLLIVNNNGTTQISGQLELLFEEPYMDFLTSDVTPTSVTDGAIVWDFADLPALGTFEYVVSFNLNTPGDTPPLIGGEILDFTASASYGATDETPEDNTFELNQEVVNAFDPNDKTALEGDKILEASVGEYMHYLIRFENLGTANAVNVVVADTIDISKYQLSTLIPIRGSHDFVTRINDNVVEFIFEDINLPFDDANNDGYVLFKIKTQETLVLGDSFSNSAAIYFDFNAPIITNEATTTVVSTLGTNDFEAELNVRLFPNPTREILNISGLENREVKALSVYNLQGQLLINQYDDTSAIDVFGLPSGVYFVKIETVEGAVFKRFLKN